MREFVCNVLLAICHSSVTLFLIMFWISKRFCYLYDIYFFLFFILFSSLLVLSFFLFPFWYILYKTSFCIRIAEQKYGVVFVTSYIPRIAVTLSLLFLFMIINKIKYCSRNEYILFIPSHFQNSLHLATLAGCDGGRSYAIY